VILARIANLAGTAPQGLYANYVHLESRLRHQMDLVATADTILEERTEVVDMVLVEDMAEVDTVLGGGYREDMAEVAAVRTVFQDGIQAPIVKSVSLALMGQLPRIRGQEAAIGARGANIRISLKRSA